ncbi:MAG TPA: WecB/TagA/CpsF family glycosyltransferase [Tepidisphaeraceae bacterium]|jgi:N-acetylglucosaminyldiphosphoundecaprenol N-acetyl-beta-D-mannosaminyltransferase|nr:WecB/TagA/CpsF family glycosyltransferase [Tepidisphaeraceae bacterium]
MATTELSAGHGQVAIGLAPSIFTDQAPAPLAGTVATLQVHHRPSKLPIVTLKGQTLHAITEAGAVDHIIGQLEAGRGGWCVTPNLDHIRRLTRDRKLRALYSHAGLVVADGMPLIWASRIQGTPLPERVAGSSLISSLSAAAGQRNRSIYLLGGAKGTAEQAAEVLKAKYPGVRIAGIFYPEFGFESDEAQVQKLIADLVAANPDIVYVALGSPKQEWLIGQLRGYFPRAWWLGIGISFSFLSGHVKRAPRWMQQAGLEWLHRLAQEPRRLARRYLVQGLPFAASLFTSAIICRLQARRSSSPISKARLATEQ